MSTTRGSNFLRTALIPLGFSMLMTGLLFFNLSCSEDSSVIPGLPVPYLDSISPKAAAFGDTNVVVTFVGKGFVEESVALWGTIPLPSTILDSVSLEALVPDEFLLRPDQAGEGYFSFFTYLSVSNDSNNQYRSNFLPFTIGDAFPVPELHSLDPVTFFSDTSDVNMTILGADFVVGCTLSWDELTLPADFQDPGTLRVTIPDTALAHGGEVDVRVVNPPPGGGPSNSMTVTVVNPAPTYKTHTPFNLLALQGPQSLTVIGTGFTPDTIILWNGEQRPTTFVNRNEVMVFIPESDLLEAGTAELSVFNPPFGGGQTSPVELSIYIEIGSAINDMVYDPDRDLLYLSISGDGGDLANTVITVDPANGEVVTSFTADSDPNVLALSADGRYLYVSQQGGLMIRRHCLEGDEEDLVFSLGTIEYDKPKPLYARDIEPLIESPGSIAVSAGIDEFSGQPFVVSLVMVFDDDIRRPILGPSDGETMYPFCEIIELTEDPLVLVGTSTNISTGFKEIRIMPDGLYVDNLTHENQAPWPLFNIHSHDGRIYSDSGLVVDGKSLTTVGQFNGSGPMAVDVAISMAYFLPTNGQVHMAVFDISTFELVSAVELLDGPPFPVSPLVKVGADGLAFLTTDQTMRLYRNPIFAGDSQP